MKRFLNLPSPAMLVGFCALLLALGGTAVALPGTSTVDSGDIKNKTIRGKDVRNNTLGGSKVKESSLGKVPKAASADTAGSAGSATTAGSAATAGSAGSAGSIAGVALRKVNFRRNATLPATTFFSAGGLVLKGACTPGDISVTAESTNPSGSSTIRNVSHDANPDGATADGAETLNEVNDFINTTPLNLLSEDDDDVVGQLVFQRIDSSVVVVNYMVDDGTSTAEPDCTFVGSATVY